MSSPATERWNALRCLFESGISDIDILAQVAGVSANTIKRRAKIESWTSTETGSNTVLARLNVVFSRQVSEMEALLDEGKGTDEKSARTLGTLARTWEKLMEMEKDMEAGSAISKKQGNGFEFNEAELDELRAELERRIGALVEQKNGEGFRNRPQPGGAADNTD